MSIALSPSWYRAISPLGLGGWLIKYISFRPSNNCSNCWLPINPFMGSWTGLLKLFFGCGILRLTL